MQAVEDVDTTTERRSHDAGLASYLEKLLRQQAEPQEPAPPAEVHQQPGVVVEAKPPQDRPPDDRPPRTWNGKSSGHAEVSRKTRWPKAVAIKRPKPSSGRRTRTKPRAGRGRPKNPRQIAMTVLIPVLAVTLVVLVRRPAGGPAAAEAKVPTEVPKTSAATGRIEIDWEIPPVYEFTGRDPMRLEAPPQVQNLQEYEHPATPVPVHESLDLKGVLYSEDRPTAIIGTRVVHEGEQIAGATIIAIERDGVELERDGRRWRLSVSSPTVQGRQATTQSPEDGF